MTPAQLLEAAECYIQEIPRGDQMGVLVYLVAAGGAGGNAQLVTYTVGPPANPANISNPAIAYDPTGILPTLGWNTTTHQWT